MLSLHKERGKNENNNFQTLFIKQNFYSGAALAKADQRFFFFLLHYGYKFLLSLLLDSTTNNKAIEVKISFGTSAVGVVGKKFIGVAVNVSTS